MESILQFLHDPSAQELLLTGAAGTGKSTLINTFLEENKESITIHGVPMKIYVTATTHKAKGLLRYDTVSTIHSLLGYNLIIIPGEKIVQYNPPLFTDNAIIIIDEASMLEYNLLSRLRSFLDKNIKVIYIGDPYQLPAINSDEAKSVFADSTVQKIVLNTIHRTKSFLINIIIKFKDRIDESKFELGDDIKGFFIGAGQFTGKCDFFSVLRDKTEWKNELAMLYKKIHSDSVAPGTPVTTTVIGIAYRNEITDHYTEYIRNYIWNKPKEFEEGEIIVCQEYLKTNLTVLKYFSGRIAKVSLETKILHDIFEPPQVSVKVWKIWISESEYFYKIANESNGVAFGIEKNFYKKFRKLEAGEKKDNLQKLYQYYKSKYNARIFYNYVGTVYKSQGSTYHTVFFDLSDVLRLYVSNILDLSKVLKTVYTAITRASHRLVILI